jgi:hypothetical protein
MNSPLYFGSYYRFLGWFSVASTVLSLLAFYWVQQVHLDFSFVIWLWLGTELKEGKNSARKWAAGISIFVLFLFALSAVFAEGNATAWGKEFNPGSFGYYIIFGVIFALVILPGLLLLSPNVKRQFKNKT